VTNQANGFSKIKKEIKKIKTNLLRIDFKNIIIDQANWINFNSRGPSTHKTTLSHTHTGHSL